MTRDLIDKLRRRHPLVEAITNYVTVNDVANVILACGGSPVMADCQGEVPDFVRMAQAVLINIGTVNESIVKSIFCACETAREVGIPVILDPVGAGATEYRTSLVREILQQGVVTVLRGNASELAAVAGIAAQTRGVDAALGDEVTDETLQGHLDVAQLLAGRHGCVAAMSGRIDIISDGHRSVFCRNGVDWMPRVTGTGCALSGLTAAFVGAAPETPLEATAFAFAAMGIAGEIAYGKCVERNEGTASFRIRLIDALSLMDDTIFGQYAHLEER